MTSRTTFGSKYNGETQTLVFDFTSALGGGETLSTASTTSVVFSGTDASPSAVISGASAISGSKVTQKVTAGTAGVIYNLICAVTTNLGQTLQQEGYLAVLAS